MMEEVGNVDSVDIVKVKVGNSHQPLPYIYILEDFFSWKLGQFINLIWVIHHVKISKG